jgi:hypothetical protein
VCSSSERSLPGARLTTRWTLRTLRCLSWWCCVCQPVKTGQWLCSIAWTPKTIASQEKIVVLVGPPFSTSSSSLFSSTSWSTCSFWLFCNSSTSITFQMTMS